MNISQIKGYIFDLDGTLIDSMPLWYNVDRIFLSEHGIIPPDNISEIVKKMTVEQSSKYFLDTFNLKVSQQEIINRIEEIVAENYRNTIPLKEGISELLDYLDSKNIPYGVATATYRSLAVSCLTRLGLINRIKFLETCSEIGKGKEFPDIFFRCAERLGLPPESIAVVEDSLYSLETAKNNGFFTIAVYDKSSHKDWWVIPSKVNLALHSAMDMFSHLPREKYIYSPLQNFFSNPEVFKSWIPKYQDDKFIFDYEDFCSDGQSPDFVEIYNIKSSNGEPCSIDEMLSYMIIKELFYDTPIDLDFTLRNFQSILKDFSHNNIEYYHEHIKDYNCPLIPHYELLYCVNEYLSYIDEKNLCGYSRQDIIEKFLFNLENIEVYLINSDSNYHYERYIGIGKNKMFLMRIGTAFS